MTLDTEKESFFQYPNFVGWFNKIFLPQPNQPSTRSRSKPSKIIKCKEFDSEKMSTFNCIKNKILSTVQWTKICHLLLNCMRKAFAWSFSIIFQECIHGLNWYAMIVCHRYSLTSWTLIIAIQFKIYLKIDRLLSRYYPFY